MKRRDLCAGFALLSSGITVQGSDLAVDIQTTGPRDADSNLDVAWDIGAALAFVANSPAGIDLNDTLPAGMRRGGTFGVDSAGSPLPAGMTLTPDGWLVGGSATVGLTTGVRFTYRPS